LDVGDLFGSGLEAFDLSFGEERGARATSEWAKIAQIHRFGAETPLLVVLLAKRGISGGAIGSGKAAGGTGGAVGWRWAAVGRSADGRAGIPHWRHGQPKLGGCRKERQRRSGSTALLEATRKMALIPC
jgi:hypothetical protein